MSALMTDDELDEFFGVAELSEPFAYTNISSSSITPMPRVLLLPTVWSPTDEPLAWAGLTLTEEGNGEVCMEGISCQWLQPTSIPNRFNAFLHLSCL